jgi:uncharacterized protein YjeT (DUF2065 family)
VLLLALSLLHMSIVLENLFPCIYPNEKKKSVVESGVWSIEYDKV